MFACKTDNADQKITGEKQQNIVEIDLDSIKALGELKAITTYSPTGYFLYRGETMGFEYELLKGFSDKIGVDLKIVIAKNLDSMIPMLLNGTGDIIASGLTITNERKKRIAFTDPFLTTHQVLVQRKPENWRKMGVDRINKQLIKDVTQLIRDTVSVIPGTVFYDRLAALSAEVGDTIYINTLEGDLTVEEAIKMVNDKKIKYTVADYHIAKILQSYYPDIDINTPLSLSQRIAWGVRKNSPQLLQELNTSLKNIKINGKYNILFNKYFKNRTRFRQILNSKYYTESTGIISKYDNIVKKYAALSGFDWRLIKAQIYVESRFKNHNKSWAGASGLMQIMPATAKSLGINDVHDPEQNIRGGIKLLKMMYNRWNSIPDSIQRVKFALASYNSGYGHVTDAKALAKKFNADTLRWDNGVAPYILKLSKPKYYNDPVVKYGYVRGMEPYNYVNAVFNTYETYKNFVQ